MEKTNNFLNNQRYIGSESLFNKVKIYKYYDKGNFIFKFVVLLILSMVLNYNISILNIPYIKPLFLLLSGVLLYFVWINKEISIRFQPKYNNSYKKLFSIPILSNKLEKYISVCNKREGYYIITTLNNVIPTINNENPK